MLGAQPSTRPAALLVTALLAAGCSSAPRGRLDVDPHTFRQRVIAESAARGIDARLGVDDERREILSLSLARRPGLAWSRSGDRVAVVTPREVTVFDPSGEHAPRRLPLPEGPGASAVQWRDDDRLWAERGDSAPLEIEPDETDWRPVPTGEGRVLAVSGDGQRVVAARAGTLRLLERGDDGFSEVPGFSHGLGPVAFGDGELYAATAAGIGVVRAATGERMGFLSWPGGGRDPDLRPVLVAGNGWLRAQVGERYVFARFGDGAESSIVRDVPRQARWCSHGGGPDAQFTCLGLDGRWWVRTLDRRGPALPDGVLMAVVDPSGTWVVTARHDGIWAHVIDVEANAIGPGTHLGPLPTRTVVGAIEPDGDRVWVMGLEGADRPALPVLAERGPEREPEPRDSGALVGAFTRLGARVGDAPILDAEIGMRLSWSLAATGGAEREPSRAHRLMLGGQLGVDVSYADDDFEADLRLALPIIWRTRTTARFGDETYVGGWPLSVVLEPGFGVIAGAPDLTLSVMNETWGGGYVRATWDRANGVPLWSFGLEGGMLPTKGAAAALLVVGIVVGLANADWDAGDGFCYRCGPMWQE